MNVEKYCYSLDGNYEGSNQAQTFLDWKYSYFKYHIW